MPPSFIEHILPQDWDEHWPLRRTGLIRQRRERTGNPLLHSFGNLTLVTSRLNKALSNAPWLHAVGNTPCKKETLTTKSLTRLREDVISCDQWDEDKITIRAKALFAYAGEIWPGPRKQLRNGQGDFVAPAHTFSKSGEGHSQSRLVAGSLAITGSAQIGSRRVIQYESGTIAVEVDGAPETVVMPILRKIADELGLSPLNGNGNAMNTRQLGKQRLSPQP